MNYVKHTAVRRFAVTHCRIMSIASVLCIIVGGGICPGYAQPLDAAGGAGGVAVSVAGDVLSLDLKGIDVIELLKIVSVKTGYTIAPTKAVQGRVTLFLKNVGLQDVLDIISVTQGLAYEKKGMLITFMTAAEYSKVYGREFNEKKSFKTVHCQYANPVNMRDILNELKSSVGKVILDEASGTLLLMDTPERLAMMVPVAHELDQPLETAVFDLNYADPAYVQKVLTDMATPKLGTVVVDERAEKVIVTDLPERVAKARRMVISLDEATRQVRIEGKIIQVVLNDSHSRGIEWERLFKGADDLRLQGVFAGEALTHYGRISAATIADNAYTAVFDFLQEYGTTSLVSSPSIVAVNNQEARVLVGTKEAFISHKLSQAESTTVTSESVEFIDVGVKLNVRPSIGADGFITMLIKPEISSVNSTLSTAAGSVVPIVATSEAETAVKVKDGTTVMITGLIKEDTRDAGSGVPVLGRLPLVGTFFSTRAKSARKTELVVFLTPHIMRGDKPVPDVPEQEPAGRHSKEPQEILLKGLQEN